MIPRRRLIEDASKKYFTATTSVQVWLGIKIFHDDNPTQRRFWGLWGVRSLFGVGMVHRETTANINGNEACLDVHSDVPLVDQFRIPSRYIYYPHDVPENVSPNLIIRWEMLRLAIEQGYQGL
jgi:hypothetical protein